MSRTLNGVALVDGMVAKWDATNERWVPVAMPAGVSSVTVTELGANTTLVNGTHYCAVATAGGITITLPASPANGDSYEVANDASTAITVSGNGHNIGGSSTETLNQYESRLYRYSSTSGVWVRI